MLALHVYSDALCDVHDLHAAQSPQEETVTITGNKLMFGSVDSEPLEIILGVIAW